MRRSPPRPASSARIRPRGFVCAALFLLACPGLFARGSAENKSAETYPEYAATITGVIRLVGNEPFSRLVVSADDGKTYIIDEDAPARKTLHSRQGQRARMEGRVREYPVSAGKIDLGVEYFFTPARWEFLGQGEQ